MRIRRSAKIERSGFLHTPNSENLTVLHQINGELVLKLCETLCLCVFVAEKRELWDIFLGKSPGSENDKGPQR